MAKRAHFEVFREHLKNIPCIVFVGGEKSKTGLGFEIGQRQQKIWRKLNLQSLANPAVLIVAALGQEKEF